MPLTLSMPARINILGNPSDGNEGDFATISAAISIRAEASIESGEGITFEHASPENGASVHLENRLPLVYDGKLDLLKGAVNQLAQYSPEFREKLSQGGFRLRVWSRVPRQSGLGGSSLFVLLTLAGLRSFYSLDPRIHNDYIVGELAQRVEEQELNIACGFADRYVPLFGGLAYLDYRGKLYHTGVKTEPLVTYERLDPYVTELPLVATMTGVRHDSGDVHGRMRPRYIQEYDAWIKKGGEPPPMVGFMKAAWDTAWRGKIALLEQDFETFGHLMNQNHQVVDNMMKYCGFPDGAGWANNLFIEEARKYGALGAKLTGAGGGGSVFALVKSGDAEKIMQVWRGLAKKHGLTEAKIYRLRISRRGLVVRS